jgi:metallo-beta-lactamase family protein
MKGTLTFFGASGTVTGANFLFEIDGKKILVDCGLFQGDDESMKKNYEPFPYDVSSIDYLLVTHAHTDHIGRIPKLVRDGFRGTIYSTAPTKEISELMFDDAVGILSKDAEESGMEVLYDVDDFKQALALWKTIPYHATLPLSSHISVKAYDAGHVLGSAMFLFSIGSKSILFTGDLGNTPTPLLHDTEVNFHPDYIVMESVYGDRNHPPREDRRNAFEKILEDTILRHGTVMIPAFSLERTQEILFELNDMVEHKRIERVPIYLDSPLAIAITEVYRRHTEFLNDTARHIIHGGDDIFDFPGLRVTRTTEESKSINEHDGAKIIIAGSGMMNGGRMLHHARRYLSSERNTLLFVGYQAPGTLGRVIYDGINPVRIFQEEVPVKAHIEMIAGYSGHKGSDELVEFVEAIAHDTTRVFCVMGETKSALFLVQRLRDTLALDAEAPQEGDHVVLDFS